MNKNYKSISIDVDKCKGCTKCMLKCPVEAIRLKNEKAVIYEEKCIECGECIKACTYKACLPKKNELEELKNYKVNIVIPTVTMYSQFADCIDPDILNEGLNELGFNEVYDITYACDIAIEIIKKEIDDVEKPTIGIFCPCIESLIKTMYPSLMSHVLRVITPIEIAATNIREKYLKEGYRMDEIGIFHISSCSSWKSLTDTRNVNSKSKINGIIPFSDIYGKLIKYYDATKNKHARKVSYSGLSWAYSGGISETLNKEDYIYIDGIENVKMVFDDIIKGRLSNIEFIEPFVCSTGCLGGIFLIENPYNARRITKKYAHRIKSTYSIDEISDYQIKEFTKNINMLRNNGKLDENFIEAVKKMKYMNELINKLPGTDCGMCGSPSCRAFAEDVVRGLADIEECKYIREEKHGVKRDNQNFES